MKQILERLSILHKSILKEGIRLNVQTFAINLESLIDDMTVELAKEQEIEKRKIIQVSVAPGFSHGNAMVTTTLIALCDDGTLWQKGESNQWEQIENIPQSEI